jgi:hypothetical protein
MANLSSIITQTVGNSSGGVNLITAPSQSSIWTATGLTLSTTTTASELPLEGFSSSAVKFLLTGSTTSAYVDFLVPTALAQTKLGLQWYARANVTTIGSITLSLSSYASAGNRTSNTSPTTVTLQTSSVASAATSFNTTFDTANQQYYRLTLNFPASASNWYTLAQFVLGPGIITQGAAISEWTSFTPTFNGVTVSNNGSWWRRVGSEIEIMVDVSATADATTTVHWNMTGGLTGITVDTAKIGSRQVFGSGIALCTTNNYTATPSYNGSTCRFALDGSANLDNVNPTADGGFDNGDRLTFEVRYPVAEWAGNGTVNLGAGAQVEYASTSGTWDAASSTTVYGPAGQIMGGALTADRVKTVTFQYPIQADDQIFVEFSDTGGRWWPAANATLNGSPVQNYATLTGAGPASVGLRYAVTGTNTVDVTFARYQSARMDDGSNTANWPSTTYWRVRKAKASSPVGFGLATQTASGLITREVTETTFTMAESAKANLTGTGGFGTGTYVRQGNLVTCNITGITGYSVTSSANVRTYVIITPTGLPGTTTERSNTLSGTCWVANGSDQGITGRISYASTDKIIVEFTSSSVLGTGLHAIYNIRFSYFMSA